MGFRSAAGRGVALGLLVCGGVVATAATLRWVDPGPRTPLALPGDCAVQGGVTFGYVGDTRRDLTGGGFALDSSKPSGAVTWTVGALDPNTTRWYRFSFRGLPQSRFSVGEHDLAMEIAFFGDHGRVSYDAKAAPIDEQIDADRRDLAANGVRRQHGAEVWRSYHLDVRLPFPQVDSVKLTVRFDHGAAATPAEAAFLVTDLSFVAIPEPFNTPAPATRPAAETPFATLLPLGGRWFYAAKPGETVPKVFDAANVDRLLYQDSNYSAPFAGNTTATLRAGFKDAAGAVVTQDRTVADNVTIEFDVTSMIVHTHGLPNHPTGRFPEMVFGNPSYIQEQAATYYFPLAPKENPRHQVTDAHNANRALHMGPIGLAVNGVVFFNPFDMGNVDATDMMDRCCGHPNQDNQYHYHKYPICVNSPWADVGETHSPLIGFAFDGYPVYGPYEAKDVMAKDVSGEHALNGFNMHYDADRGWHYHVTPGKFPYLIGGFWGVEDQRDADPPRGGRGGPGGPGGPRRGPPPGGGPGRGPPPGEGPPFGPP